MTSPAGGSGALESVVDVLTVHREGSVVVLVLNRPHRKNALSLQLQERLTAEIAAADRDVTVRAVVLTGGTELFSAGADLNEVLAINDRHTARLHLLRSRRLCLAIESARIPIVAAISGHCITGGLELALACDLRIADSSARFAMSSSRIGGLAGFGGTQRLPRLIGVSRAKYVMMLAHPMSPEHALAWGIVDELVSSSPALTRAMEVAQTIAARAPLSIEFLKDAVNRGLGLPLDEGLNLELDLASGIFETADRDEGVAALRERRAPRFERR